MVVVLVLVFIGSVMSLKFDFGKVKNKLKFFDIFFKLVSVNILLVVWLFLFGVCDVWFVIVLFIYLGSVFGWDYSVVGGFLVFWVIGYGVI